MSDEIRVIHGDCLDVLPTLNERPALILTDPPYGVTYQSNRASGRGTKPITNDGTRLSLWLYRQVVPLLRGDHLLWFTRWDAWPDVWAILGQSFPLRGLLIWDKGSPGMGDLTHWGPSYEMIASLGGGKLRGRRDGSVLRCPTVSGNDRDHPTEKPVALLCELIEQMTDPGDLVLDPFAGSGSTLVAALKSGRRAIGIEVDERYIPIIRRRLAEAETPLFREHAE